MPQTLNLGLTKSSHVGATQTIPNSQGPCLVIESHHIKASANEMQQAGQAWVQTLAVVALGSVIKSLYL